VSDLAPFPMFHGTSTLYTDSFRQGYLPGPWPYRDEAIALLQRSLRNLTAASAEVEPWILETVAQHSGASNWQHGQIYVTPSRFTALKYAETGGRNGGELLCMCSLVLNRLEAENPATALRYRSEAPSLERFLVGAGSPMLVVFDELKLSELEAERDKLCVDDLMNQLNTADPMLFDLLGQQCNFRLKPGTGTVSRIEKLGE